MFKKKEHIQRVPNMFFKKNTARHVIKHTGHAPSRTRSGPPRPGGGRWWWRKAPDLPHRTSRGGREPTVPLWWRRNGRDLQKCDVLESDDNFCRED